MDIDFIGVPFNLGCDRDGVQFSPDKIRDSLSDLDNIKDAGDVVVNMFLHEDKFSLNPKIKYLREVVLMANKLAVKVSEVQLRGGFPLVVGGDHSIALGSVSASASNFENLGVVWIDAHCDINTDKTSPSGNAHGMILASLLGFGEPLMAGVYKNQIKLNPKNVILIAQRSFDSHEREVINSAGVHLFDMDYINKEGMVGVEKRVKEIFLQNDVRDIHISFDIDSIDPILAPGTGTVVNGGLTLEQSFEINDCLFRDFFVRSMDIVEFNPLLDIDDITKNLCLSIISRVSMC